MRNIIIAAVLATSFAAHAGIPEVLAAEAKITEATAVKRAAEKALTPKEKAQLNLQRAQIKLDKANAK